MQTQGVQTAKRSTSILEIVALSSPDGRYDSLFLSNYATINLLDEIARKAVQTAVSLASHIIRREVKPQEHEALIGEAINEFSNVN